MKDEILGKGVCHVSERHIGQEYGEEHGPADHEWIDSGKRGEFCQFSDVPRCPGKRSIEKTPGQQPAEQDAKDEEEAKEVAARGGRSQDAVGEPLQDQTCASVCSENKTDDSDWTCKRRSPINENGCASEGLQEKGCSAARELDQQPAGEQV